MLISHVYVAVARYAVLVSYFYARPFFQKTSPASVNLVKQNKHILAFKLIPGRLLSVNI